MSYDITWFIVSILLWASWVVATETGRRRRPRLPPGPKPWPVVGNIPQLIHTAAAAAPHQSLAKLAKKHGPVMTLRLGSVTTVVVSTSTAARDLFRNNDAVLAGRMVFDSMKGDMSSDGSLSNAQYGLQWRKMRRLYASEFFAAGPLESTADVRSACIEKMVRKIENSVEIDIGEMFFFMMFDLFGNLIFSRNLSDTKEEEGRKFFYHTRKIMEWVAKPNVVDFFPILKWFDPQRIRNRTQFHVKQAYDIVGEFLKERSIELSEKRMPKDYLDALLEHNGSKPHSSDDINVTVLEMFIAGTDTATSVLEWAMVELLRSPGAMHKLQTELRTKTEPKKPLQEGSGVNNLPYLKAVIKETLRLHPPLPFLVPRMSLDSCKLQGYHVPAGAQVLVNVWAIGRDPESWEEPLEFKPERFLEKDAAVFKGCNYELLPFGAGRRICPAASMAARLLPVAVGAVVREFDWEAGEIDVEERMGIAVRKSVPLKAVPRLHKYL